ncbi:MAG: phosphate/phosphite/phosphonate ABC transporter substrate-binding protein [Dehalococcoidia bacterium]|nr:MAG: phosphate/phosphite/phosphonate ABC transporter substrate-binding protein [Dehalococcoidia bacterium]
MNRHWRNLAVGAAAIAAVLLGAACGSDSAEPKTDGSTPKTAAAASVDPKAGWPKQFHIGLFGGDDAEEVLRNNNDMKGYLEQKLGVEVKLTTGTSYGAVIEAMRAKRVDAMVVGPFSYLLAVQEAGAEALAVRLGCGPKEIPCKANPTAKPYYQSVVFTKKGSGVNSLADLKGKGFAFVDPASTSGHLAPKTLLIKSGYANPDKDMQTVFAGSHPTAALAVYNGKTPAGGTNESNLRNLVASKQVEACLWADGKISEPRTAAEIKKTFDECPNGKLGILALSDPIPSTPLAVRSDLPESFKKAVKDALLAMKDDAATVEKTRSWYVDPHEALGLKNLDAFYDSLRDIAKLLNLDLKSLE